MTRWPAKLPCLKQPALGKREAAVVANDAMVEDADIDQRQSFAKPAGDELVGLAGFGNPGRMVVRDNHLGVFWVRPVTATNIANWPTAR